MNKNIWLIGGILVAVVLAGLFLLRKPQSTQNTEAMPVSGATNVEEKTVTENTVPAREVEVSGDEYSFAPLSISVQKGEKIKIVFTNKGALPHNLVIDELGVSTKTVVPGQSDTIEFTAESDTNIKFYCSIGNHRSQGMEGTIEVK